MTAFDAWWAARPINDRLSFIHHDRETYTREGWGAGSFSERSRLREKVGKMERHTEDPMAREALRRVLALLAEPGEER